MDIPTGTVQVRLGYNPAFDSYDVYVVSVNAQNQVTHLAEPLTMVPITPGESGRQPTLRLPGVNAQAAVDMLLKALEREGIRPQRQSTAEGELDATKRHLEDMRTSQAVLQAALIRQLER